MVHSNVVVYNSKTKLKQKPQRATTTNPQGHNINAPPLNKGSVKNTMA